MKVLIPTDADFNYQECKKLFEENQHLIEDYEKFDDVIHNTFFYSFIVNGKHIGFSPFSYFSFCSASVSLSIFSFISVIKSSFSFSTL